MILPKKKEKSTSKNKKMPEIFHELENWTTEQICMFCLFNYVFYQLNIFEENYSQNPCSSNSSVHFSSGVLTKIQTQRNGLGD